MLYISKTIFVYRFYKILVIEPTTEVKAESIGAPSVKEIDITVHSVQNEKTAHVERGPLENIGLKLLFISQFSIQFVAIAFN